MSPMRTDPQPMDLPTADIPMMDLPKTNQPRSDRHADVDRARISCTVAARQPRRKIVVTASRVT